ncbi:MAG: hypothetical protein KAH77_03245 [Thiomargarita sp.]|nr:hypothetical protein [Thiomargarita sp.]
MLAYFGKFDIAILCVILRNTAKIRRMSAELNGLYDNQLSTAKQDIHFCYLDKP